MNRRAVLVDLNAHRAVRDGRAIFREVLDRGLWEVVAAIAEMHAVLPDDWIDRKTETVSAVVNEMIHATLDPLRLNIPGELTEEQLATIEAAAIQWGQAMNARCRAAFCSRLVDLLGP